MKKDKTISFDPNNKEHLKALDKLVKKISKKKPKYSGLLMPEDIYNEIKAINKKSLLTK